MTVDPHGAKGTHIHGGVTYCFCSSGCRTKFAGAVRPRAAPPAYGLIAAVTVLINAYPCAPGLATPKPIMVGVDRGAQEGVLVKNAGALERMEKVDTQDRHPDRGKACGHRHQSG